MPRYKWHVITDPNKITLFVLGHIGRTQAPDTSKGESFVCGEIAYTRGQYFRLGGRCSPECKAWYKQHRDPGYYKPELGHYINAGERNKRGEK